jgi:Cys/Met metabolism PLP-dependent enzyme
MNDITKALRCRAKEDARPSVTPMYLTSGFEAGSPYFYSRKSNPNIAELEAAVATLEGAAHGLAVTTGMTAIALVLDLLEPGETLCVGRDIYGCWLLVQVVRTDQRQAAAAAARGRPHSRRRRHSGRNADGVLRNADQSVSEDR